MEKKKQKLNHHYYQESAAVQFSILNNARYLKRGAKLPFLPVDSCSRDFFQAKKKGEEHGSLFPPPAKQTAR